MTAAPPVVLVDMNVVLDLVLVREPWASESGALLAALQRGQGRGMIAGHTVTTIYYLVARESGPARARRVVQTLLDAMEVVPVTGNELRGALVSDIADYEDAVQSMAAKSCGATYIATRNVRDFEKTDIPALLPGLVLSLLAQN